MKPNEIIIPIKFYTLMIQFILTIVVQYTFSSNVDKYILVNSNEQDLTFDNVKAKINNQVIVAYVLQSVELLSLISSQTIFKQTYVISNNSSQYS